MNTSRWSARPGHLPVIVALALPVVIFLAGRRAHGAGSSPSTRPAASPAARIVVIDQPTRPATA